MSSPPLLNGPIPPYSNIPIEPQNFQPSRFVITAVSLGLTTTITTAVNHNYIVSQECRLLIPFGYGCTQLNQLTGLVSSIPSPNQVVLTLNSQNSNAFISASLSQQPQIVAIGSINTGAINANGINSTLSYVPGAFKNIST